MTAFYRLSIFLFIAYGATPLFSQSDDSDNSDQASTRITGIALDVFPLLDGIFSDDSNADLFTVNYVWGHQRNHYEIGISPHFSRTHSESDDPGSENPELKIFGFDVRVFHGKTRTLATKWFATFGMTYEYQYAKEISKTEGRGIFSFHTIGHTAGLGPQLMFGYRIADEVWIRSRIAGLLQYDSVSTKIKEGSNEVADQNLNMISFEISKPTFLELVYIF